MEKKTVVMPMTPELLEKEQKDVKEISKELLEAIEPVIVKHFDGKMVSLDTFINSFKVVVSYSLAEALNNVPIEEKSMVLQRIGKAFGPKIGIDLLMLTLNDLEKDLFGKENTGNNITT